MRNLFFILLLLISSPLFSQNNSFNMANTRDVPFNSGWLFSKGSISNAELTNYDDSSWKTVDLPHDWSIEDLPNQKPDSIVGPFSLNSIGKAATGWTEGGTGWYRKKFTTDRSWQDKYVSINFDGVYMNSDVWLNGFHLGNHPYGYTPFYYDFTPYLKPSGQENILVVRVRNEGRNSRWYSGSGIYRQVSLTITGPVHVENWGVNITTPEVSEEKATLQIATTVNNKQTTEKPIKVVTKIFNSDGKEVKETHSDLLLSPNKNKIHTEKVTLLKPSLWSIETPTMYNAVVEILDGNKVVDRISTPFGIRSIQFDSKLGFLLNGKKVLLKGGCIHHDNGPMGSMAFSKSEERKIEIMKKNGFNAIRSSHNPASKAMLEACDRLGMLVIDEAFDTWVRPKNPQDYNLYFNNWWQKDLQAMILRGRNHPSIIMWSIGNEIYEVPDLIGQELAKKLTDEVRRLDPTRPVTEAMVYLPPFTKQSWEAYEPHIAHLDIDGYNYFVEKKSIHFIRDSVTFHRFESEHAKHPDKLYYGSETLAIGALENWKKVEDHSYVLGCFKWTAFDYIGEAGIGFSRYRPLERPTLQGMGGMGAFARDEWPIFNSYCGDFDLIGTKKASSYYQDVVWRTSPIELLVNQPAPGGMKESIAPWGFIEAVKSWTWPGHKGKKINVIIYSRCEKVKLELNGKVIAEKEVPKGSITTKFEVEYQPGTLIAKGFNGTKEVGSSILSTTGKPVAVRLIPEQNIIKASKDDLVYVNVEIVDEKGNIVPYVSDIEVNFEITGNATIAAVGNGNPKDISSFQQPHKQVFRGRSLIILRPTGIVGDMTVKATASGLKEGSTTIKMK